MTVRRVNTPAPVAQPNTTPAADQPISPASDGPAAVGPPEARVAAQRGISSFQGGSLGANDEDGMINRVKVPARAAIHFKGKPSIEGATLSPEALAGMTLTSQEDFGSTTVQIPVSETETRSFKVRDMLYPLGGGKVGAYLIPVADHDPAANAAMDAHLRARMGLKPDEPIYTLVAYLHPEAHTGKLDDLATEMVKTEMGSTHLGAYLGEGRTTNSPERYHERSWEARQYNENGRVIPYPANVQVVSMAGVDQATVNKNLTTGDAVLNKGVSFPDNYMNDVYRTVDLNTTLMFYRDWLKGEPYLRSDDSWRTYCAEHKTIAVNVGLNVPHNLESFKELYGADEGSALWETFKERFKAATGRDFTAADETHFEPLWKKEGISPAQLRPPTKAEYDAWEKARFDGSLRSGAYQGYEPLPVGRGLAWRPETSADLVKNFIETYAPFREVGAVVSAAAILGFKDQVTERMGLSDERFQELAMPMLQELFAAEALARAPADKQAQALWLQKVTATMYVALGGKTADFAPGATINGPLMAYAQSLMAKVPSMARRIAALERKRATPVQRNDLAAGWLREAIQDDLQRSRQQMVASPSKTEYYSPPAVTNRVANGLVDSSRFVKITTVATAVDVADTVQPQQAPAPEAPAAMPIPEPAATQPAQASSPAAPATATANAQATPAPTPGFGDQQ